MASSLVRLEAKCSTSSSWVAISEAYPPRSAGKRSLASTASSGGVQKEGGLWAAAYSKVTVAAVNVPLVTGLEVLPHVGPPV